MIKTVRLNVDLMKTKQSSAQREIKGKERAIKIKNSV